QRVARVRCLAVGARRQGGRDFLALLGPPGSPLLCDQTPGISLRSPDQIVPVLVDVFWRSTLERNVVSNIQCVDHVDRVPRANLGAMLAADAAIELDIAPGLQ